MFFHLSKRIFGIPVQLGLHYIIICTVWLESLVGVGNLIWRIGRFVSALLNEIPLIFFMMTFVDKVWKLLTCQSMSDASFKDSIVQVLTRQCLICPIKFLSLSDKQVEKTNAEVKRVLEGDTSRRSSCYSV